MGAKPVDEFNFIRMENKERKWAKKKEKKRKEKRIGMEGVLYIYSPCLFLSLRFLFDLPGAAFCVCVTFC